MLGLLFVLLFFRALSQMKIRLKGAQKGHRLLKKKADALTHRFRIILGKIIQVRILDAFLLAALDYVDPLPPFLVVGHNIL